MKQFKLLIVDDDVRILTTLSAFLRDSGFSVLTAGSVAEGLKLFSDQVDLALLDLALPDGSGIDLLREIKLGNPAQPVIMISGEATLGQAVEALKLGAGDFLEKPVSPEKVEISIRNLLKLTALERRVQATQDESLAAFALIGESEAIRRVRADIEAVSRTDSAVLLLGESGTGKEVVANLIHLHSSRQLARFVAVNAAAIPAELIESEMFGHEKGAFTGATQRRRGRFEQADGGTLFLDEIAEMPARLQAKLLRVLEERQTTPVGGDRAVEVDFRLICATNRDLQKAIKDGDFRRDLYFRVNVFSISLPSLRDIPGDIEPIAQHQLQRLAAGMGYAEPQLPEAAVKLLRGYSFPGNVRELRNILENLLIVSRGAALDVGHLKELLARGQIPDSVSGLPLKHAVRRFESDYISSTVRACNGNISEAATRLGLDRSYLYRKMRQLDEGEGD